MTTPRRRSVQLSTLVPRPTPVLRSSRSVMLPAREKPNASFLSRYVRPATATPPLAWLDRTPHIVLAIGELIVAFLWLLHSWWGLAVHLMISGFILFLDGYITNSLGKNIVSLRANGVCITLIAHAVCLVRAAI